MVMFRPEGQATPLLIARWRAKGAVTPLQPDASLLDGKAGSDYFRSLWRIAFPTRSPLPSEDIATDDLRFTDAMLNVWL
jgi:hypothetical protein